VPPVIDNPILNSPFAQPGRHWVLDDRGIPSGAIDQGRRRSEYIVPVPPPRHITQGMLDLDDEYGKRKPNDIVNDIRDRVAIWRQNKHPGVTPVTRRLLEHWTAKDRTRRLFFCQIEAAETAIWLAEVAPRADIERLRIMNPEVLRIALKLATGAGKTTVMAMLIAWQTLNVGRNSSRFTDRFLIIAPGITVKDRLRVLQPSDPDNTYTLHDIVPLDLRDRLQRARIVITNYHAFKARETMEAPKLTKEILGWPKEPISTTETEGAMIQRVCKDLLGGRRIVVLNDEAHHCYRAKRDVTKLDAESRTETRKRNEAARLWINGIEALQRVAKVPVPVYDLSATPFYLRGSGETEGTLFPWVVSDFSLIDAIECGIVKVPRVPVQDVPGEDEPIYRHVYRYIQEHGDVKLPRAGRGNKTDDLDPERLPSQLTGALQALYGHYAKVFEEWREGGGATPPVFIVVCNNTATSKLVFDWVAGYQKPVTGADGAEQKLWVPGKLPLFSNVEDRGPADRKMLDRPVTLLIDSQELESGDPLSSDFRKLAGPEIDAFKSDLRQRGKHAEAEALTDSDLLREVMNTVGQVGRLGEQIRCVVSVYMLTEGWDARTVKHVLGVRAFGTQLLCEQVIGRALRRVSYDPVGTDDAGNPMFEPEYADVLGIPFSFIPANSAADYKPPKKQTRVEAVDGREAQEIRFPRVLGYRVVLPPGQLKATFTAASHVTIDPTMAPSEAINAPLVGQEERLSLDDLSSIRSATIAFHLAKNAARRFIDGDGKPKPWLFPSLLQITQRWMNECLHVAPGAHAAYLMWDSIGDLAAEPIYRACVPIESDEITLRAMLDPYNETGSSRHVGFNTTKTNFWPAKPERCQINLVVCDGDWEAAAAQILDSHPAVLRYVKNDHLGFEVPYVFAGQDHRYRPDFIAVVDDGRGAHDPLSLVLEVKGEREPADDAKDDTMWRMWVPAINAAGRFGRWAFLRLDGPYDLGQAIDGLLASAIAPALA
jgi:type III restriction enzyme